MDNIHNIRQLIRDHPLTRLTRVRLPDPRHFRPSPLTEGFGSAERGQSDRKVFGPEASGLITNRVTANVKRNSLAWPLSLHPKPAI